MSSHEYSVAEAPARLSPVPEPSRQLSRWLFVSLAAELILLTIIRLPYGLEFDAFAFSDIGSNFTIQHLVSLGLRPGVDFGDPYGLLPILSGKILFSVFGMTPIAYQAAMLACGLVIVWALAQIATSLQFRTFGIAILVIGLGFAIQVSYPNLAHIMESALLALALSAHSSGNRNTALAFTCAGLFCKPSMSYVYGLVLVILIAMELRRSGASFSDFVRAFAPAAITGTVLVVMFAMLYSPASAIRTLFPLQGISTYHDQNFGFFLGVGRSFWNPPNQPWLFYLIDFSGFWNAGSIFLVVCGVIAAIHWHRHIELTVLERQRDEILWTCAILHLAFIFFFFGNKWSWICYSFILILGIAAAADFTPMNRRLALLLCVLGLSSWIGRGRIIAEYWRDRAPSPITAGLWAPHDETLEWRNARAVAHGKRAIVLETKGAAGLIFPEFALPVALYLDPGLMQPSEIKRQVEQLGDADIVVVCVSDNVAPVSQGIPKAPEIERAMMSFERISSGKYLEVYRRRGLTASGH
jgi:hypothetical protein